MSLYKKDWRSTRKQDKMVTEAQVEKQCAWHAKQLPVFMFVYQELIPLFCNGQILKGLFSN